jgi:hypothetical protein
MAFNFSPTAYTARPLDFSDLANLPDRFWKGQEVGRQAGLRDALGQGLPTLSDGSIDWAKAASIVGQFDPELGMRTAAYAQKNTMNPYQAGQLAVSQQNAETNAARAQKPSGPAMTQSFKAEDERDTLKSTIANLEEAKKLLEGGVYEGGLAGAQTELGSQWNYGGVPEKLGLTDSAKAQRSQAFQQIVSPEAMKLMAEQLKGSTAYQELLEFKKIWANPAIPNHIKLQQLDRTIVSANRHLATKETRIKQLRGGDFNSQEEGEPEGGADAPSPYQDGQTATNPTTGEKMLFQNGSWVPVE